MQETAINSLASKLPILLERFRDAIEDAADYRDDLTVVVRAEKIREVIHFLKTDPTLQFNVMMDLFGVDYQKWLPPTPERFAVVYNLYSMSRHARVFIKAFVKEHEPQIDSIHDLYKAANWFEREVWDLYGIVFRGHPNLHRILCHADFEGHPLRKDYPADKYQRLKSAIPSTGM